MDSIARQFPVLRMDVPRDLRIRAVPERNEIFDPIRGQWVALTPEEWVRQHVVHLLVSQLQVPSGLLAIERELDWQDTRRRADIVAYDRKGKPWMVVECKAPEVTIGQDAMDQAGRYLAATGAPYVLVTNGVQMVGWESVGGHDYQILQALPVYPRS